MAQFRSIYVWVWRDDDWFAELDPDAKLLWLYLLTNPSTSQAGIYRLALRTIVNETNLTLDAVKRILAALERDGKVLYGDGVVWVVKMREYQTGEVIGRKMSASQVTGIENDLREIPDGKVKRAYLKHYGYPVPDVLLPCDELPDTLLRGYAEGVNPPPEPPRTPPGPPASPEPEGGWGRLSAAECVTLDLVIEYCRQGKRGRSDRQYNKNAAIGALMVARFGDTYPPNFGRIGKMAGKLSGAHVALAEMIWRSAVPNGDPHDYLEGQITGAPNRRRSDGSSTTPPARPVDPQYEAIRRARAAGNGTNGAHAG